MKKLLIFLFSVFLLFSAQTALAAGLNLSPASGSYKVGDTINVRVVLSSPTQSANAVSAVVDFPRALLTLNSISKTGSLISLWAQEPTYSNTNGTATMEGVILNGYQGSNGTIVTLSFKATAVGNANIKFLSASILANDGQGTNILTGTSQANFNIIAATITPPPIKLIEPEGSSEPERPVPEVILPAPTLLVPIFTDYYKDVKENEYILVKGLADPNTDIMISSNRILSDGGDAINDQIVIKSNDKGLFTYVSENRVAVAGVYIITAQARDSSGVLGEKSLPIKIFVSTKTTLVSTYIINMLPILIPIIGFLILILLILLLISGKNTRKRSMHTKELVSKSFDILGEDVAEEIKIFKKIKAGKALSNEERLFINQLKKDIESAEEAIVDEIKETN